MIIADILGLFLGSQSHLSGSTCTTCGGSGRVTSMTNCSSCGALGEVNHTTCSGTGKINHTTCNGTGKVKTSNNCTHGKAPNISHYYCSLHGNDVIQYHKWGKKINTLKYT